MSPNDARSVRRRVLTYPLGVWALLAIVAVGNGGVREVVLIPRVGDHLGHVLSTALLVVAILVISFVFFSRSSIEYTRPELMLIGVLWTTLTVGFEFVVGYLEGTPPAVTVGQYDVLAGEVWIAVPLALLLSPLAFGSYRSR